MLSGPFLYLSFFFFEWVHECFSQASPGLSTVCVCVCELLSRAQLFATPWTVACQASLAMGFSQKYWSAVPFPSPCHFFFFLFTCLCSVPNCFFTYVSLKDCVGSQLSHEGLVWKSELEKTSFSLI